jgi:hypothetical protein
MTGAQPAEVREPGPEQARPTSRLIDRLLAVGQHQQDPFIGQVGGQEGQQVQRRPVGPVQVLHDVYDGARGAHPAEQAEHGLEQVETRPRFVALVSRRLLGSLLSRRRQQAGQLG